MTRKTRTCEIEGCDRKHSALGYCTTHLSRVRRNGDPFIVRSTRLLVSRDAKDYPPPTPQPTPCLIWEGFLDRKGYGKLGGESAHRLAWSEVHGPISAGLVVMHLCDNPPCVNVDHLRLGTAIENNADRDAKGRAAKGERHSRARLTEEAVIALRERYRNGERIYPLAREIGIPPETVAGAIHGRTWKHLPGAVRRDEVAA